MDREQLIEVLASIPWEDRCRVWEEAYAKNPRPEVRSIAGYRHTIEAKDGAKASQIAIFLRRSFNWSMQDAMQVARNAMEGPVELPDIRWEEKPSFLSGEDLPVEAKSYPIFGEPHPDPGPWGSCGPEAIAQRHRLGEPWLNPLRTRRDYQPVGRPNFLVEELGLLGDDDVELGLLGHSED
jgi:hypothetical protein